MPTINLGRVVGPAGRDGDNGTDIKQLPNAALDTGGDFNSVSVAVPVVNANGVAALVPLYPASGNCVLGFNEYGYRVPVGYPELAGHVQPYLAGGGGSGSFAYEVGDNSTAAGNFATNIAPSTLSSRAFVYGGSESVVMGGGAIVHATDNTVIGYHASGYSYASAVVGHYAAAFAFGAAMGKAAYAQGQAAAYGYSTSAGWDAVAVGYKATAGSEALAIGAQAYAYSNSIAIGVSARAPFPYGVVICASPYSTPSFSGAASESFDGSVYVGSSDAVAGGFMACLPVGANSLKGFTASVALTNDVPSCSANSLFSYNGVIPRSATMLTVREDKSAMVLYCNLGGTLYKTTLPLTAV